MKFAKEADSFWFELDREESPDIGAWDLERMIWDNLGDTILVIATVAKRSGTGTGIRRHVTYYPEAGSFRRDEAFGFFLDQGGIRDYLERALQSLIVDGKSRRYDGSHRRQRPSPKARDKHVSAR